MFIADLQAFEVTVYRNESMPWCGTVNSEDAGITVDILRAISEYGGPKFKFESIAWPRAQKLTQTTQDATIIPLTRTLDREQKYNWLVPLVPNQVRLYTYPSARLNNPIQDPMRIESYKGKVVGVIRGSAALPSLEEFEFAEVYEVSNVKQLIGMLRKGRIDVMAESAWVTKYIWAQSGFEQALLQGPVIGNVKHIYLAGSPNFSKETAGRIRVAMEKIKKNGILDNILTKWNTF